MTAEYSRELSDKVFAGKCRLIRMGFSSGAVPGYGLRALSLDRCAFLALHRDRAPGGPWTTGRTTRPGLGGTRAGCPVDRNRRKTCPGTVFFVTAPSRLPFFGCLRHAAAWNKEPAMVRRSTLAIAFVLGSLSVTHVSVGALSSGPDEPSSTKIPLDIRQHFPECARETAYGLFGFCNFPDDPDMSLVTQVTVRVAVKDAAISRILEAEKDDKGRWTMRVEHSFGIVGMGGRIRLYGYLSIGGNRPWQFRFEKFGDMDDTLKAILQPLVNLNDTLVIESPGAWKLLDPKPSNAPQGVQNAPVGHVRSEVGIITGVAAPASQLKWSSIKADVDAFSNPSQPNSPEWQSCTLAPGTLVFLRLNFDQSNECGYVIVHRDGRGNVKWTTHSDDDSWHPLRQGQSFTQWFRSQGSKRSIAFALPDSPGTTNTLRFKMPAPGQ